MGGWNTDQMELEHDIETLNDVELYLDELPQVSEITESTGHRII